MSFQEQIIKEKIPLHVAVIMDGNGRWAKQRGNQRIFGHENGINAVRQTVEAAAEIGIKHLTLYAFSTENWNRPQFEVDALMALLVSAIHSEIDQLSKNNIRLTIIGNKESLPEKVKQEIDFAIQKTQDNTGLNLIIALSYSSRWEIVQAVKNIITDVKQNNIQPAEIDESLFSTYLCTSQVPDPELLIRTSGEFRISNYLLWQIAYAELYFTEVLWPDFNKDEFFKAILDFQKRERRFGKTSEQIINAF